MRPGAGDLAGLDDCLYLGDLDSLRDWGHARNYVTMQWLMQQQEHPEDFVIATGRKESVRCFIELTAQQLGWRSMQGDGEGTLPLHRASYYAIDKALNDQYLIP